MRFRALLPAVLLTAFLAGLVPCEAEGLRESSAELEIASASVAMASETPSVAEARRLPETAEPLPSSVDNSLRKWFPPVIDQTGGSCAQASYIGYMFTYEINRLLDRDGFLPENRFSYLYTWNFVNDGIDQGSWGLNGIQLALTNGIMPDYLFPAQSYVEAFKWASGYDKYLEAIHYKARRISPIEVTSQEGVDKVRECLAEGHIVTFSGHSGGWTISSYSGHSETAYTDIITTLPTYGSHAMTIVGYDDTVEFSAPDGTSSKGAFIMCNTWGESWADRGKVYYPYYFFVNKRDGSALSLDMASVEVVVAEPQLVFRVAVECDSRDDLAFMMGVADGAGKTAPMHNYTAGIANHAGGDYPMQGSGQSVQIEFAFDFSPYVERLEGMTEPKFFLTVQRNKRGSQAATYARLLGFSVYDYRTTPTTVWTYEIDSPIDLQSGNNVFGLATTEPRMTSYSPVEWLSSSAGRQPASEPFVFRAADGSAYKVIFGDYDRTTGTIEVKYQRLD